MNLEAGQSTWRRRYRGLPGRVTSFGLTLLLTATLVAGCSDPGACTLNIVPAVEVEPRDALDEGFLDTVARGTVRDGTFQDSLRASEYAASDPTIPSVLSGADERTGTYAVHLEADGRQPWDTAGVRVSRDACHV